MKLKEEGKQYRSLVRMAMQGWSKRLIVLFVFSFLGYVMQNFWANYLFAKCKSDLYNFLLLGKGSLFWVLGQFILSYVVFAILLALSFWGMQATSSYSSMLLKRRVIHASLTAEEYAIHSGKMYQYLNQDVEALSFLVCNGSANFFLPYIAGIGSIFTVIFGAHILCLVPVLLTSVVEIMATRCILPKRKEKEILVKEKNDRLMETITNQISGIEALKTANFPALAIRSFYQDAAAYAGAKKQTNRLDACLTIVKAVTRSIAYLSCFVIGSGLLFGVNIEIGSVVLAAGMMPLIQSMLCNLWSNWGDLQAAMVSGNRLQELLAEKEKKEETEDKPVSVKKGLKPEGKNLLQVKKLGVSYGERSIVKEISIMLEPGCLIALAGQSGSGKSTIIRAIAGRIPIKEGTILVYGKPMEAIRKEERRELISYMPQGGDAVGGVLFPTTIWDNIALGLGDPRLASDQMIEEAARLAGIREYIEQLPERYQTTIGEKGISLSGGQVERILLARTLIRNTPILLLDEPTASLDEETEAAFIKQLKWLIKEQHIGVLIATHRNAVIQEADETIRL